jgi:hypothetical protein
MPRPPRDLVPESGGCRLIRVKAHPGTTGLIEA